MGFELWLFGSLEFCLFWLFASRLFELRLFGLCVFELCLFELFELFRLPPQLSLAGID